MATYRLCCPSCKEVFDAHGECDCPKCKTHITFPQAGIQLYRKGSPIGIAGGFGIYLNGQAYGYIGNKQSLCIPLPYGTYTVHIATGMNRRCNDPIVELNAENPIAYMKVSMKSGFWTNSFVVEFAKFEDMPPV